MEIAAATSLNGIGSCCVLERMRYALAITMPTTKSARLNFPYLCFLKKSSICVTDCFMFASLSPLYDASNSPHVTPLIGEYYYHFHYFDLQIYQLCLCKDGFQHARIRI